MYLQGMKNRKQRKRNREWVPNPATLDYSFVSYDDMMCRDHSVGLFLLPSHPIRKEKEEKHGKVEVKRKWEVYPQPLNSPQ